MPPRAVAILKETLVRQYGASTRDVVEAMVEGRLAGKKKLDREDLDAIEQAVLGALKQQRQTAPGHTCAVAPRRMKQQRSSPVLGRSASLTTAGGGLSGTQSAHKEAATLSASAAARLQTPASSRKGSVTQQVPAGYGFVRAAQPIGGHGVSLVNPMMRGQTQKIAGDGDYRPWATSLADDDTGSERSRVVVRPKYAIPIKPKLKPMDHWDVIVAYDSEKYRQEEEGYIMGGKHEETAKFRRVLDGQMDELRALREREADDRRREREDLEEQIRENKRIAEDEHAMEEHRKNMMKKANDEMMQTIDKQKARQKAKRDKEQRDVLNWMEMEKQRKEREAKEAAEMYAYKCKTAKEALQRAREEAELKKQQQQEEERRMCKEMEAAMDAAEAGGRQAVADRMSRIEELGRTFGAAIQKRDEEEEARLQASIKRVEEESERLAKEDAERRKNDHNRRVKDMIDTLDRQMKERHEAGKQDKIDDAKQLQIWATQVAEGHRKDREEKEGKERARAALDKALIQQIRDQTVVHPLQYFITPGVQKTELAYNRALFEQMSSEGFYDGHLNSFLSKATDKGTGKTDPYPSVGPSKLPIDPLEIPEPDVS
eukprot:TRINITY_DN82042_c0_g1_i1.p1 TRINITY_DN82042_c0_g1~~TRINITY_DN82042_c0_g1_i1.p1  ORF type:complete len:601 (-),score=202.85 TRINITY_DN82042_c0_g1_i1:174-1976(-)